MPSVPDSATLGALSLFQDLSPEQVQMFSSLLHRKTFPAGAILMSAEQPGEVAYLIVSGTVKVHVEQADGSDVILAIVGPGELIGELSLIERQERSASVVTLEASTVFWFDRSAFERSLDTMPQISRNLNRILARRLRVANAHIQALATKDIFGRVACLVLAFADTYGRLTPDGATEVPLRLTQSDLASLVGASRVRVNQVLGFYKERGYLAVQPDYHLIIHDRTALARRCL